MDREERIRKLEERREQIIASQEEWFADDRCAGRATPPGDNALDRIFIQLTLLKYPELSIEEIHHGVLVNGKYIIAIRKNKWKVKGKNKWYWYKNLNHLVENYILNKPQELDKCAQADGSEI